MNLLPRNVIPSNAVTSTDHGAIAKVVAAFCTSVTLTFLCTRLLVRWPWSKLLGWDDVVTCIATLSGIVQMILVCTAVNAGLGKMPGMISTTQESKTMKLLYASDLFYVLTMYLSRLAIVCFFFRIEKPGVRSLFSKALAGTCAILTPISIIIIASQETANSTWTIPSKSSAPGILARWTTVEVLGLLFDLSLIAFPLYLVRDLHIRTLTKFKIVMCVLFRFPILPLSIARLLSLSQTLSNPTTFLFSYVRTEIYTQAEMAFTLVSATIPTMRIFLKAAKSSLLGETVRVGSVYTTTAGAGAGGSLGVTMTTRRENSVSAAGYHRTRRNWDGGIDDDDGLELCERMTRGAGAGGLTVTRVTRGNPVASSVGSSENGEGSLGGEAGGKRAIMMRQTVDVEVDDVGNDGGGFGKEVDLM